MLIDRFKTLYSSMKQSFNNLNWLFLEKVARLTTSFFVGIYVARYLGAERYGVLTYIIGLASILSVFTAIIHRDILIKEMVLGEPIQTIIPSSIFLNLIVVTIFYVLSFSIIEIFGLLQGKRLYLAIFLTTFFANTILPIEYFFRSINSSKHVAISTIIAIFVSASMKLYFVGMGYDVQYIFYAYVVESFVYFLVLIHFFSRYKFRLSTTNISLSSLKELISRSGYLLLSGFFIALFMNADTVMLQYYLGYAEVGLYSAAVRISSIWYLIPSLLTVALFPGFINSNSEKLLKSNFNSISLFLILVGLVCAIFTVSLAKFIVFYLFGEGFILSVPMLKIHAFSLIPIFLIMHYDQLLVIKNLSKYILYGYIFAAGINIVLNLILIPDLGGVGAAISTVVAYYFKFFYGLFISNRYNLLTSPASQHV